MKLEGKVAVITGAGSGFGRQCSQLFASEGAGIAVVDIDPERAAGTVELVEQQGGKAVAITADVSVEEQVKSAVAAAVDHFGKLDIMFANAGVVSRGGVPSVAGGEEVEFQDLTDADWQHVLGVNLSGVVYSAKAAVPYLRDNGGGTILATSSAASLVAYHNIAMYSATKAGVNGLVRGLSLDLGKYGIRVNAICPTHGMSPNFLMPPGSPVVGQSYEQVAGPWDPTISPIPLKLNRPPSLLDNAKVALFLASDDSQYLSGLVLPSTDGGTLARVGMWFAEDKGSPGDL
ncbi:oxidoreductase [Nocardia sp. 852002-20019_SCH5090214]|jgi:NAD(P)-dependent dehydrogenase (short-subunit alcohol dehydrogenase family)|uniref:SDR family NAD(P)-dependent oxidoreductase n=1 Tax=Nocardia TaxID=1817 RepID=UPI0007EA08FC|nr:MULTISPECIES: SDR family oxidoreductase [Nocardia]OBF66760.1 oxidoreductase [Mycobacterium sp. 852002-51759_SCH5129042]MBF6277467.1 SDR family oxidoreductase [Nocardia nova]OBA51169.1 oxidoreductase [Nocardia sp. 852002-20019_SCH5090214]OBA53492.1 oxidoreductase [Nocardia sp. 852002-51101_SCH5132738]OBB48011.1 oxidoreductase [Nocardia sp. 852002-51244_SCH5132740]